MGMTTLAGLEIDERWLAEWVDEGLRELERWLARQPTAA